MFYQIYVRSKDRKAVRFFWRDNPFLPISEFFYVRSPIQKNGLSMLCQLDPKSNHNTLKSLSSRDTVDLTDINLDEIPMKRGLGVLWQPQRGKLKTKSIDKKLPATEREILSFISTIFDPLGFVTPAVLEPKLITQELWKRSNEWDEDVPDDLAQR